MFEATKARNGLGAFKGQMVEDRELFEFIRHWIVVPFNLLVERPRIESVAAVKCVDTTESKQPLLSMQVCVVASRWRNDIDAILLLRGRYRPHAR